MTPWAHVISSFRGQWIPGDQRGFHDHGHRVHSSGNVDRPPPDYEHRGLRFRSQQLAYDAVTLTTPDCALVGECLVEKLRSMQSRIGALAVCPTHCHALIEVGHGDAVKVFGRAKQFVSHQMKDQYPGKLWGASSHVVRMHDDGQVETVRQYILAHHEEGAWVWPLR